MASGMYPNNPPPGRPPQVVPPPMPPGAGHYGGPQMHHGYGPPPPHYGNMPGGVPMPYPPAVGGGMPMPPPGLQQQHHGGGYPGQPPLPPHLGPPPSHMPPSAYPNPHYAPQPPPANFASSSHSQPPPQGGPPAHAHPAAAGLGPSANRFNQVVQQPWGQKIPPGPGALGVQPQGPPQSQGGFSNRPPQQGTAPPPSDSIPGRREESKDERKERKRREYYEKKRLEDKQQREKGAIRLVPGGGPSKSTGANNGSREYADRKAAPAADKIENRLKRPSTFLCKIKFRNDLPDSTAQPKLMHINTDKDRYTRYQFTSLEKNWKWKLHVEPDLGIPLDLLDISNYKKPDIPIPLDPEDAALLLDDEVVVKKESQSIRKKDRPTDKGVAWLVKTQYVSPINLDPAKQAMTEKQAKDLREQREGRRIDVEAGNDRDQQIQAIEDSFKAAKQWPVHQTKPELEVEEILYLLPDFDRIGDQFVHMVFDTDPLTDAPGLADLDQDARQEVEGKAIVRSFTIPTADDSKPEKFVGYMVPKAEELDKKFYEDEESISYTWVREYLWDIRGEEAATYVFCFGKDSVQYLPVSTKLVLQKKKAKEGKSKYDTEDRDFPVPVSVTVTRRDPTQDEEDARDEAREKFMEGGVLEKTFRQKRPRSSEDDIPVITKRRGHQEDYSEDEEEVSV